jgi:NAD-dependent SIR2 family protein deacetylase
MVLSDIARLRKMPDLAHRIETFQPEPDPLAQQKAQLEIELLKAQIAKENAIAMQHQATAQLNSAKANTEAHVAENVKSDTDLKNLDFLEQESGVKQERAKELHGEQARSQMELKTMEHDFTHRQNEADREHDLLKEYVANRKS